MSESCDRALEPEPQTEIKIDPNAGVPADVLLAPRCDSRFGFLVNGEHRASIQGSNGQWYRRECDTFTLVTPIID